MHSLLLKFINPSKFISPHFPDHVGNNIEKRLIINGESLELLLLIAIHQNFSLLKLLRYVVCKCT